jgi:hypothetical protein
MNLGQVSHTDVDPKIGTQHFIQTAKNVVGKTSEACLDLARLPKLVSLVVWIFVVLSLKSTSPSVGFLNAIEAVVGCGIHKPQLRIMPVVTQHELLHIKRHY